MGGEASERIRVSAIVVTRGRAGLLRRCVVSLLESAGSCSRVSMEIIVLFNGAEDGHSGLEEIQKLKASHPEIPVRILCESQALTPAAARNRTLAFAAPGWVYFADDDAYVDQLFFERFVESLKTLREDYPGLAALGGPNITPTTSSFFQTATGIALSSRFATYRSFARYACSGSQRPCGEDSLILCNLFVAKETLPEKPFPEDFVCSEENWLLQTLAMQGRVMVYDPQLWVWHERRPTLSALARQVFRYGWGRGQNLRRRPSTLRMPHILPSLALLLGGFTFLGPVWNPPVSFYALFAVLASVRATLRSRYEFGGHGTRLIPLVALLFPVIHCSYGLGVLWGLTRRT